MDEIPGGKREQQDGYRSPPVKKKKEEYADDDSLPTMIAVKSSGQISSIVPGHVWRCRAFKWHPVTFAVESEQLNSRFIEPNMQDKSLTAFLADPSSPMIYGVSGNPDDGKAKYFAAFLVAAHLKALGAEANVIWAPMYGGFDNPHMNDDKASPTLLVLTNLTPNSTSTKLEKARDLIEKYSDVPRIIVAAGIDPLSFLATRLYVPINALAYFSEGLVKAKVEII